MTNEQLLVFPEGVFRFLFGDNYQAFEPLDLISVIEENVLHCSHSYFTYLHSISIFVCGDKIFTLF